MSFPAARRLFVSGITGLVLIATVTGCGDRGPAPQAHDATGPTQEAPHKPTATPTAEPTAKPTEAIRLLRKAAVSVEARATTNTFEDPDRPEVGVTAAAVEGELVQYDLLPEGANIVLSWPKERPQSDPNDLAGLVDLGYELCAELADGSWASWDSRLGRVSDSGMVDGCPA